MDEQGQIPRPIKLNFIGGYVQLTPAGVYEDRETRKQKPYDASIKICGLTRFPIKLSKTALLTLKVVMTDPQYQAFFDGLK